MKLHEFLGRIDIAVSKFQRGEWPEEALVGYVANIINKSSPDFDIPLPQSKFNATQKRLVGALLERIAKAKSLLGKKKIIGAQFVSYIAGITRDILTGSGAPPASRNGSADMSDPMVRYQAYDEMFTQEDEDKLKAPDPLDAPELFSEPGDEL